MRGALFVVASLLCWPCRASADEDPYAASARVQRPLAARNPEDATAAATTIELTNRPLALETLREVIPEVPGAIALSSGGYGAFSSVSLRGTDLAQTVWVLGDVPLNGPDGGAFDMSLLPMSQLARLEVYRSGAPVWLGQGSIGGVIRVVPREAEGTGARAQLGAGSFGLYEARASSYVTHDQRRPVSLFTSVQVTSARNDYPYLDDNATAIGADRKADDVERRLRNAELLDASGLLHARVGVLSGNVDVVALALGRTGGVPGTGGLQSNAVFSQREQRRGLLSLAYTREGRSVDGRRYRFQVLASGQGEQRELDDPYGELNLGGPRALDQNMGRLFGRVAATVDVLRMLEATISANYTLDSFRDREAHRTLAAGPASRHTQAVAGELRLFGRLSGMRGELRGSVRSEYTQTELSVRRVATTSLEHHNLRNQVYRLAGLLEPVRGLSLRGSVGTGSRVPSTLELFGDGSGTFIPNPTLRPEHGRYADAGVVWSHALFGSLCLLMEAQGFWSEVDDKIVQVSRDASHTQAMNLGRASVFGTELGAEISYREYVRFVSAATLMDSDTDTGQQLPRQPKLRVYGRLEGSLRLRSALERVTVFATASHLSTAYYDIANLALRQPLTHIGFGAALGFLEERFELQARVADVLDARGQDYQRLPLSGRFVGVLLTIKERKP